MLNIAIADDEQTSIDLLTSFIDRACFQLKESYTVSSFPSAAKLLTKYVPGKYDAVFLDIEMAGINGMDAAHKIRGMDEDVILIFVTQMAQYAIEGYRVEALDYIVKPVDYFSFEIVFRKILRHLRKSGSGTLRIDTGKGIEIIPVKKVYYIEVTGHYITYHTEIGDIHFKRSLIEAMQELDNSFYQTSRYCIVNLRHITAIHKNCVIVNGDRIEVSRSKRKDIITAVNAYMGGAL